MGEIESRVAKANLLTFKKVSFYFVKGQLSCLESLTFCKVSKESFLGRYKIAVYSNRNLIYDR